MNRIELGTKLTKIAEDSVDEADGQKTASSMLTLAKELVSFDPPAEMEKTITACAKLGREFREGAGAQILAAISETEAKLAEQQEILKSIYKDWEVKSGYRQMRAELIEQAHKCMAIGDSLTDLSGELTIGRRESEQESYQQKYNILVSMLNEAELNKYSKILNAFFRKQRTELDNGLKELNDYVEKWHESAKAIAEERGVTLPALRGGKKFAGFVGDIMDTLKTIIPGFIKGVQKWGSDLYNRIVNNGKVLDVMEAKLGRKIAQARSVLK